MKGRLLKIGIGLVVLAIAMVGLSGWAEDAPGNFRAEQGDSWVPFREQIRPFLRELVIERLGHLFLLRMDLDLTTVQREQLREVASRWRGTIAPAVEATIEKKRALRAKVLADSPDEHAIRQAATEFGEALGDAAVRASGFVVEARTLLSLEQQERLKTFRESREEGLDKLLLRWHKWLAAN